MSDYDHLPFMPAVFNEARELVRRDPLRLTTAHLLQLDAFGEGDAAREAISRAQMAIVTKRLATVPVHDRAYAPLELKNVDAAARTIRGIASTVAPDRVGDIIEPAGASFTNPVPLLLHHDQRHPVGAAILTPTAKAITFTATLAQVKTMGALRDRVEEAWESISSGLIRGVSVGFRALADGVKLLPTGGRHFTKTEIVELSLVTIPANVDASITNIKHYDAPYRRDLPFDPQVLAPRARTSELEIKADAFVEQVVNEDYHAYSRKWDHDILRALQDMRDAGWTDEGDLRQAARFFLEKKAEYLKAWRETHGRG